MTSTKTDDGSALKRMQKELYMIENNKIDGVSVTQDKNNQFIWNIAIKGPKTSPYEGGTFEFRFKFSEQYPFKAPYCTILTGIYHPYYSGINSDICLKSLRDGWSPSLSMRVIIVEIQTSLLKPSGSHVFNYDAFHKFNKNRKEFNKKAAEWTKIYAMKYEWTKEKQTKMLKESKMKKNYVTKMFQSVNKIDTKEIKEQKKKDEIYTKKILSKKTDGNASKRETLLHVIYDFAKKQNKNCLFSENKKNKNSQFITGMSDNKNQRATLVLDDLSGLITDDVDVNDKTTNQKHTDDKNTPQEESKTDDSEKLQKEVCVLRDAIKYKKKNATIENIRKKIAKSYNVDVEYVQINDIYYGSVHVDYNILTQLPQHGAVTERLRREFQSFRDLNLHPLFFDFNFNVDDFDKRGNKKFASGTTYQVGPTGRKKGYIQPTGWHRFGLKVLDGRYGPNHEWLHPFQHVNNWYRAYHGTQWQYSMPIVHGTHPSRENPLHHAYLHPGRGQVHARHASEDGGTCGEGVYCSPDPNVANGFAGTSTIQTTQGPKTYRFMFQVCVDPSRIKICRAHNTIWVAPERQLDCIRPYGILLKEQ